VLNNEAQKERGYAEMISELKSGAPWCGEIIIEEGDWRGCGGRGDSLSGEKKRGGTPM